MANRGVRDLQLADVKPDELVAVLSRLTDAIAVHDVVADRWGSVVDASVLWWNDAYQEMRYRTVSVGDPLTVTHHNADAALGHLTEAWTAGRSIQVIHLGNCTQGHLRDSDSDVEIWVTWQRLGDHVVETACSLDGMLALRRFVRDQQSLVAIASRKRAMAVERERIARNLHDVVIQNLYATSLSLSIAGRRHGGDIEDDFNRAIEALDKIIAEIRCEILAVESEKATRLRLGLEDALLPILEPTGVEFELTIDVPTLPTQFQNHIKAVCVEATSNAVRHGGARRIDIRLTRIDDLLILTVADDGTGISDDHRRRNGLHNMRERAQLLGGDMHIDSRPGTGTTVEWSVPYPRWTP